MGAPDIQALEAALTSDEPEAGRPDLEQDEPETPDEEEGEEAPEEEAPTPEEQEAEEEGLPPAPPPPPVPDQAAQAQQLATVFAQQLAAQQHAQWEAQQRAQQAAAYQAQQARQQSPEFIAETMMEAGLNPEDPAHVFIYQQHAETVRLQNQLQQYQQQYQQTQKHAYQMQVDAYLGTQVAKSLEGYDVPAETSEALLQIARGYAASGLDPAAAIKAAVQPFSKMLTKKSVPAAKVERLPTPNKAGMRAVAATGKGSGRTPRTSSGDKAGDLYQRMRAIERGGR